MKPKTLAELRNVNPVTFDASIKEAVKLAAQDVGREVVIKALSPDYNTTVKF